MVQETQEPKVSQAMWNRSDAAVPPCRDLVRQQKEVKARIASKETEMSMLLQASKEAGVAKKRVERELLTWNNERGMTRRQELHYKNCATSMPKSAVTITKKRASIPIIFGKCENID